MVAKFWDISQTMRVGMPVWPGDTAFSSCRTLRLDETCPVNVGRFTCSTHTGSHADAPLHYARAGVSAAELDVDRYVGACTLVDASDFGPRVTPSHIEAFVPVGTARILFRLFERFPHADWPSDFAVVSPAAIDLLAERGGVLIGVDTPSLDPLVSKTMEAHRAAERHGMSILEGLVLEHVPPGDYELIAPPLKLAGLDASPVRALLRSG